MQVASKKVYWKNNSAPNTCAILSLKKIFYQNLTDTFFQISLKCIKLVIPKILFILVLCSFDVYFKITWPPPIPQQNYPPLQQRLFWNFTPPQAGGTGGACPEIFDMYILILVVLVSPNPVIVKKMNKCIYCIHPVVSSINTVKQGKIQANYTSFTYLNICLSWFVRIGLGC